MDSKRSKSSMSVGRLSLSSTSSTMSGFRQLASVGRLGRKSRPASIISSSSSVDSTTQSSCVNRDTSSDDCGLHRFIVWAAVRRNLSARISDDERRECPLIKCAQRFSDHERMLQHLYRCEHLPSGQYFCHECSRIERFSDAKCRRCLNGNPSRRRKIISKAKSFFSSLGNKSKGGVDSMILEDGLLDFTLFVDEPQMGQAELPSDANEIFEIDSNEVGLGGQAVPSAAQAMVQSSAPPPFATGIDNRTQLMLAQWEAQNQNRHHNGMCLEQAAYGMGMGPERSCIQASMDPTRMSSVRSNASTGSTTSNISNFSTWSNVSGVSTVTTASTVSTVPTLATPVSPWSDAAWAAANKMTTSSMPVSPGQLLSPVDSVYMDTFSTRDVCGRGEMQSIPELPAEPVLNDHIMDPKIPVDFTHLMSSLPVSLPVPPPPSQSPIDSALNKDTQPAAPVMISADMDGLEVATSAVNALLEPAWEVLKDHISSSLTTLRKEPMNPLAVQIYNMSPETLATTGLVALKSMLETDKVPEPVDALCFAHVAFAFSFSLDERHTDVRVIDLYRQVLTYGQSYPSPTREAYTQLVKAIWEPSNLLLDRVDGLNEGLSSSSLPGSPISSTTGRGKAVEASAEPISDRLVSMAWCFLDRLEHAVIKDTNTHATDLSSLASRHIIESTSTLSKGVLNEFGRLMTALCRQYSENPALVAAIRVTLQPNVYSTVRRVELELLEAGRIHLPWRTFFEAFVPLIHSQFTPLYRDQSMVYSARSSYHSQGIELVTSIDRGLSEAWRNYQHRQQASELNTMMGLGLTTSGMDWAAMLSSATTPANILSDQLFTDFTTMNQSEGEIDSPASSCPPNNMFSTPKKDEGMVTPPSPEPTPQQTLEADDGCELCDYRPKGDPRWFKGSMAKHMKNQHGGETKIHKCPYPGCNSQYKNRPDNLRAHMIEKNHFVDSEQVERRPHKRRRVES